MLSDSLLNFAQDGVALNTGGAGSYIIGDQVDLGVDARGIGSLVGMTALFLVITINVAPDSAGEAATAQFSLVTDSDPALGSPTVVASTAVIDEADLTVGSAFVIPIPSGFAWERYMGLQQTTAGEAFTAGEISAIITSTVPNRYAYPQGDGASLAAS